MAFAKIIGQSGFALSMVLLLSGGGPLAHAQSYIDPTASLQAAAGPIAVGDLVHVGPFASLSARHPLLIGSETSIQDNVTIRAIAAPVELGDRTIVAHGASVVARVGHPVRIGLDGACPGAAAACPAYVGFNARVEGVVEKDAMVLTLARVGPGVRIPSGRKVLAGANVTRQAEVAAKTAKVVEADRLFMDGLIAGRRAPARQHAGSGETAPAVSGGRLDPDGALLAPEPRLPAEAAAQYRGPIARNRIIGDVRFSDSIEILSLVMGEGISLRAGDSDPLVVGSISEMASNVSFHAPSGCSLDLGDHGIYGFRSIVHGGPVDQGGGTGKATVTGKFLRLGDQSVLHRSRAGDNVTIGYKSVVEQSDLPSGTVIGDRVVIIGNVQVGRVEW